jgi:hypothetical protein
VGHKLQQKVAPNGDDFVVFGCGVVVSLHRLIKLFMHQRDIAKFVATPCKMATNALMVTLDKSVYLFVVGVLDINYLFLVGNKRQSVESNRKMSHCCKQGYSLFKVTDICANNQIYALCKACRASFFGGVKLRLYFCVKRTKYGTEKEIKKEQNND